MTYLKFGHEHVDPLLEGQKWVTARLDLERDIGLQEHIELLDEDAMRFATAKVDRIGHMSALRFVATDFDGHESYRSTGQFLDVLRGYYPDREDDIWPNTRVVVIWLDQIEERDGYRQQEQRQPPRGER